MFKTFKSLNKIINNNNNKSFYTTITKFTKEHSWVTIQDHDKGGNDNDLTCTFGLTEIGVNNFDDVLYVKFPIIDNNNNDNNNNNSNNKDLTILLETMSDQIIIKPPIENDIKLISINQDVIDYPHYINSFPTSNGWLCKFKLFDLNNFNKLMNKNEYDNYCKNNNNKIK